MHRIVTLLAAAVAALVVVVAPAAYFASAYHAERVILVTEAEINARLVSQIINANPMLWQYESERLEELLKRRPTMPVPERRDVRDLGGKLIAHAGPMLDAPLISQSAPVHDSGLEVGRLVITRSLRPIIGNTALVALAALLLAGCAFFVLRSLPLRAMHAAITAARRDNERAIESEARFRTLWQTSADAIIIIDVDSRIRYANPAVAGTLGWQPDELIGQDLAVLQPQALAQGHRHGMGRYLESGSKRLDWKGVETTARRKNGEEFPVEIVFSELELPTGRMFAGFLRDITARKRAEATIRENEERLLKIFHVSPDAKCITIAEDGTYLDVNDNYAAVFGFSREELLGRTPTELNMWVDTGLRDVIVADLMREGVVRDCHGQARRKDGAIRDMRCSMVLTRLADNERPVIIASFEDVTEQLRAQRTLEENERRYRLLFDSNPHAMFVYDWETYAILAVNQAAVDRYGYSREEFPWHGVDLLRGKDAPRFASLRSPHAINAFRTVTRHYAKSGQAIDVEVFSHGLDVAGRPARLVLASDITESKRAKEAIVELNQTLEQRVRDRTAELETVNAELESFSYSVSHDLRAPVRHISAFSQFMLADQESLTAEHRDFLSRISRSAQRMGTLIDDLLLLSRAGRAELQVRPLDLEHLVREVREECMGDFPGREVLWRMEKLPTVLADEGLLRMVLINLLSNALKFTAKVPQAVITIGPVPGNTGEEVIAVRDNGAGFDMQYADKLFGVFERLHSEQEFAGTGIGLATVRRIIERLGGRVWAEGEVDKGAVFYIALKAAPPGAVPPTAIPSAPAPAAGA